MAKWIEKETMIRTITAKNHYCSHCGRDTSELSQYCPDCGSYMDNGVSSKVTNSVIDHELEQSVKKFLGISPYEDNENVCKNNGLYYRSLQLKFGADEVSNAVKTISGVYNECKS